MASGKDSKKKGERYPDTLRILGVVRGSIWADSILRLKESASFEFKQSEIQETIQ